MPTFGGAFKSKMSRIRFCNSTDWEKEWRAFWAWASTNLKRRARWHAAVATALNDTYMEEGIARAISQRDEAKAFVRVVPLDRSLGTGRAVELRAAGRRISEIAGRWLVIVVGEITAAARAKISISVAHVRVPKAVR